MKDLTDIFGSYDIVMWMALAWSVAGCVLFWVLFNEWTDYAGPKIAETTLWRYLALYGMVTVLCGRVLRWW